MSIPDRFIPDGEIRIDREESLPELGDRVVHWVNVYPDPELAAGVEKEVVDLPGTADSQDVPYVGLKDVQNGELGDTTHYAPLSQLERKNADDTEADA